MTSVMIGRTLARYQLLEEVGHGGMAVVYKGRDTALDREVAVKVLHPHLAGQSESRVRLEREAQAVAKLRHENILEIFDYSGADSADSFIVTEFIHGPTLTAFLKDHPIRFAEVAAMIIAEVARALEHAHQLGVIHRDVKPDNIMIGPDGVLKLTDFGIAQIVDKERMTVTGQLIGSPSYMAPEHVEGGRIDFRTDVFACGILAYQLATGTLPFRGKNPHEVLKRIAECQFMPPQQANPLCSAALARIIARALARSPVDRFAAMGDMRRELCDELRAVGLEDPRLELHRFFADPEGWERDFQPRLVASLSAFGQSAARRGEVAVALEAWGRALSIDPGAAEVEALVRQLERRHRWRRVALWAIGASLIGALGGASLRLFTMPHPSRRPMAAPPPRAAGPPRAITPLPAPPPIPVSAPATTSARPPSTARPTAPARRTPGKRAVEVHVVQKGVQIFVDGELYGAYDGQPLEVTAGPHDLLFRNPCCADRLVHLGAEQTETELIKLSWKSGTLLVETEPADAEILFATELDAVPKAVRAGAPIAVRFPSQFERHQMKVHLTVSAPGHATREQDCLATAGARTRCAIVLTRDAR